MPLKESRPKANKSNRSTTPRKKPSAVRPKGVNGRLSQKQLLFVARNATPPAISDEPADLDLAVRHPIRRR
jgi:hypothetical protein